MENYGIPNSRKLDITLKRGAKIYAEIVGYGETGDAYHMTAPEESGNGAARAMQMAMEQGNINPNGKTTL